MLSLPEFESLVKSAPLISIDFVILNVKHEVLLGLRNNNPAKGSYFIPGGRIFKDETIKNAVSRLSIKEFGIELHLEEILPLGIFEQFYETNFFEKQNITTHYLSMPFIYNIQGDFRWHQDSQHEKFEFFTLEQALENPLVHVYTKKILRKVQQFPFKS